MKSTLHLKVINPKGMHTLPSQSLSDSINQINNRPDITIKISCAGKLDSKLVNRVIDLSKESFSSLDLLGYGRGCTFYIEIKGENSRETKKELIEYIDFDYLEVL